ncbi:S49 family peptidase [Candidatus Woesearchaeota archaeon]|nr:S49 family peptidase [Candidatus Woesearchaeota archaeon]
MEKKENHRTIIIVIAVVSFLLVSAIIFGVIAVILSSDISIPTTKSVSKSGEIATIYIDGFLSSQGSEAGFGTSYHPSAEDIAGYIKDAGDDPNIVALIIEIDSPGGEVYAGSLIGDALAEVNKTKVALIKSVGASGGYWIALHTDYIVAHRYSITGSVGVISSYPEFDAFLEQFNISYNRIVSGEFKDIGDPFVNFSAEKRTVIEGIINSIQADFVDLVVQHRGLTKKQLDVVTTGRYFLGSEALQLNLIDELGGEEEARDYIITTLNLTNPKYVEYKKTVSFFDMLNGEISKSAFSVGEGISSGVLRSATQNKLVIR